MPDFTVKYTKKIINKHTNKNNAKIAILGLSYKGNTGDTRESPAFEIIEKLKKDNYTIGIYDPHVENGAYKSLKDAVENASLCLILADHDEFKNLDYEILIKEMDNPIILDTKNIIKDAPEEITLFNFGNLSKI